MTISMVKEEYAFTAFSAITLYNSIELIILCLATFKRYQGVYFWSLLITSCSLIVNTLGFILLFFVNVTAYVSVTIVLIGWYCMITGHSIVLWSRLHLVLHQPRVLRAILYLIITNAIIMQIPTTVLLYGAVSPAVQETFTKGYNIIERIQLVVFCLQESLLSGLYIWETAKMLYLRPQRAHRLILLQLLAINIIILGLDIVVVVFQYTGLFSLQVVFKPVAYSIKLRLEYAILGRLVVFATGAQGSMGERKFDEHFLSVSEFIE
ncbi:hypothetical protein ASPVEDRAFT_893365 [Aspergillus versicolor CBS 583.65]|uniref:DUF7703 domain-containing protein n=1 Tax=Aspergillus versicolor CBS 583.65 TaxID=1036611 RepID=A0A1L9PUN1_ASPVE|nr:uncharacterized protein ASPVEDRAFT_893365 [Aspergillus versicolor CBS 583.65]OJJ05126.1 hypothetical protein ASPVEDRAFT_893365 [Aspergillus versicolor CBS 583.65]